jgi:hypothetical protein
MAGVSGSSRDGFLHLATAPVRVVEQGSNAHMNDWGTTVVIVVVSLSLGLYIYRR